MSYEHNIPKVASFLIYEQFCLSVAFCPKTEEATFCCSLFPALFRASEATVGFVSGWIVGTAPAINLVCFFSPISFTNVFCDSRKRSADWVTRPPTKSVHFPWTNLTIVDANWHLLEICASYALFLLEFPEYWTNFSHRTAKKNTLNTLHTRGNSLFASAELIASVTSNANLTKQTKPTGLTIQIKILNAVHPKWHFLCLYYIQFILTLFKGERVGDLDRETVSCLEGEWA